MFFILLVFAADVYALRSNPGVASMEQIVDGDERRIIHIQDWHLVPKDDFAVNTKLASIRVTFARLAALGQRAARRAAKRLCASWGEMSLGEVSQAAAIALRGEALPSVVNGVGTRSS